MKFVSLPIKDHIIITPEPLAQERSGAMPISRHSLDNAPPLNPDYIFSTELQAQLSGKKLLLEELNFPIKMLHEHHQNGYITYHHGVKRSGTNASILIKSGYVCGRCGNKEQRLFASFSCARCGSDDCTYCRKCIMMGRVSECTPLISWTGPQVQHEKVAEPLSWHGELSQAQKAASDQVVQTIQSQGSLLVWAVCGAGKTEVLFHGIATALKQGMKVCLATPRTDVVLELTPRLKTAFAGTKVISLFGGSEDRHKDGQLVIATTHQLLRYDRAFDVIIVDEVDAFPYSMDPSLQYAVNQAKKETAATVLLTATPSEQLQQDVKQGNLSAVTIPARYHRHPLPVARFEWCGNWRKRLKREHIPENLMTWIKERLANSKQAFLFVPDISVLQQVTLILKKIDPRIEGVHAEDPARKEKVAAFRKGEIPFLVTTTILERGVTVPNIDVAVLGSEADIFTESALVQISGRVGRSAAHPTGDIVFFHFGKTEAMLDARRHLLRMNEEARRKGLIGGDG